MTRTTAPTRACAAGIAVALPLAAPAAPANAQAAIFELSSGSSRGSSEHNYRIDPNDPSIQVPDQPALGSAYTGAAPVSLALAVVIPLVTAQFIVCLLYTSPSPRDS